MEEAQARLSWQSMGKPLNVQHTVPSSCVIKAIIIMLSWKISDLWG